MFSSIRVRLLFTHLAVIVLAMALSGALLLSFLERYFYQAAEDSLLAQARITAQALIPGVMLDDASLRTPPAANAVQQQQLSNLNLQASNVSPTSGLGGDTAMTYLADASLQLGAQLETRIRILDSLGRVLVDSGQTDQGLDLQNDPLVIQALAGQHASQTDSAGDSSVMNLAFPATVNDQLVSVVYLSQPLNDITLVLQDLQSRLLLSTAIGLLLSGVVAFFLSRTFTHSLRQLTMAAGQVAQGQFDLHVPVNSQDELGQLSRAFNDMAARLRAARQMQTDFVANVSHELRTPLTSVKATVETLRDGAMDDLAVRDSFLASIEAETNRLIRLVNDLLLLSRADSEALNLRRHAVNLTTLARETVERLTLRSPNHRLNLADETKQHPSLAWADPDRVEQVLVNLLDNAIKYSPPGSAVTIRVNGQSDDETLVQIMDEGTGIPEDELPRIGQRFYRTDKARTRSQGGSGLGLAIAQSLVQAHGGRLWLANRQDMPGLVVSFTLPTIS